MRAIQIASLDGPQAAHVVEIDEPTGGDGDVVVDVHAAGVAFPDALQSRGLYQYKPEMPYTPGAEIAGLVRSAPENALLGRQVKPSPAGGYLNPEFVFWLMGYPPEWDDSGVTAMPSSRKSRLSS